MPQAVRAGSAEAVVEREEAPVLAEAAARIFGLEPEAVGVRAATHQMNLAAAEAVVATER